MEPLIQKENLGIVHHIIIYGCYDDLDRDHYFRDNNTGLIVMRVTCLETWTSADLLSSRGLLEERYVRCVSSAL